MGRQTSPIYRPVLLCNWTKVMTVANGNGENATEQVRNTQQMLQYLLLVQVSPPYPN